MRIEVTIKDTMAFWEDQLGVYRHDPNGYTPTTIRVYDVPDEWLAEGKLTREGSERICEDLYGANWRSGNGDGSRYVVLEMSSRVLTPDDPRPADLLGGQKA